MSRWKALPVELDPSVLQLVARLRRLKDLGGLSMRQLAARTGYSPKSWGRYLGGRSLPPRDAVVALARVSGEDPTRLLALHEVAAEAWANGRGGTALREAPVPEPDVPEAEVLSAGDENPPNLKRSLRVALVAGAVTLTLAVPSTVLVTVRVLDHGGGATAAATPTPSYPCRMERVDGRWYAGNSRTGDAIVQYGSVGPEVAEAQCLLGRADFSPGDIDGIFGPLTRGAVKAFQRQAELDADGVVGPHTWKTLRR
ncbi:peptidoglycan-binding protein [Streptomyces sp. GESEQ-35]|uniref:peptidoglycan-binding protein n=1 Tax=Streptomyces sp. GESEQ-35 TaxID=2812657 RepID=UPI001B329DAE|nr:peptidoglycan-binding protein [Streptomyces sp. GESEQ-35]